MYFMEFVICRMNAVMRAFEYIGSWKASGHTAVRETEHVRFKQDILGQVGEILCLVTYKKREHLLYSVIFDFFSP